MYKIIIIILVSFISCNNENHNTNSKLYHKDTKQNMYVSKNLQDKIKGYLIILSDKIQEENGELEIYNLDKSVFAKIKSIRGNEPSNDKLVNNIYAYYPDYYIIHFQVSDFDEDYYKVKIGKTQKLIQKNKFVTFFDQSKYLLEYFCITNKSNPLRKFDSDESELSYKNLDYSTLNFICLEVKGDWIKVKCNIDCEGCGTESNKIEGWIRWRKNGKIIIEQRYSC